MACTSLSYYYYYHYYYHYHHHHYHHYYWCRIPIWRTFWPIQWHVIPEPHCRVLPPGEFSVMIPELCVILQGAASGRIQRRVIPEPRITLQGAATWWIHCHDSRATCHIAGCSHLTKSMSWSCHITGFKNSIRHIENRFSPCFIYFLFVMQFRLWRAAVFVSSPIHLF